jgi:hypothetical protein
MGCGSSKIDVDEKYAFEQNAMIDRKIRQDKKLDARTVKILLLGRRRNGIPLVGSNSQLIPPFCRCG